MRVQDVYSTEFATAKRTATIYELIKESVELKTNGIFIVDENGHLEGLVTIFEILEAIVPSSLKENPNLSKAAPADLFIQCVKKKKDVTAESFMQCNPPTVSLDTKLIEIAANSLQTEHYRLPVLDDAGKMIGVVNRTILRKVIAKEFNISI